MRKGLLSGYPLGGWAPVAVGVAGDELLVNNVGILQEMGDNNVVIGAADVTGDLMR